MLCRVLFLVPCVTTSAVSPGLKALEKEQPRTTQPATATQPVGSLQASVAPTPKLLLAQEQRRSACSIFPASYPTDWDVRTEAERVMVRPDGFRFPRKSSGAHLSHECSMLSTGVAQAPQM